MIGLIHVIADPTQPVGRPNMDNFVLTKNCDSCMVENKSARFLFYVVCFNTCAYFGVAVAIAPVVPPEDVTSSANDLPDGR